MYKFDFIELKNISSHKSTRFDFLQGKCTFITGINEDAKTDDDQPKSNGSGKSSIFEGINLAINGESLKDIVNNDIIANGESEANVVLQATNLSINKVLRIERTLFSGTKSAICKIFINDQEQTQVTDPNAKNAFIYNELGIQKSDFSRYYLLTNNSYNSFIKSSDSIQKEIINRFTHADVLDDTIPLIDKDQVKERDELSKSESLFQSNSGKLELLNTQLLNSTSKEDWDEKQKRRVDAFKEEIQSNKDNHNEISYKIDEWEQEKVKLSKLVLDYTIPVTIAVEEVKALTLQSKEVEGDISLINQKMSEIESNYRIQYIKPLDAQISEFRTDLLDLKKTKVECDTLINEVVAQLGGHVECPSCSHKFLLGNKDLTYDELIAQKEDLAQTLIEIKEEIINTDNYIKKLESDRKVVEEKGVSLATELQEEKQHKNDLLQTLRKEITSATALEFAKKQELTSAQNRVTQKESDIQVKKSQQKTFEKILSELSLKIKAIEVEEYVEIDSNLSNKIESLEIEQSSIDIKVIKIKEALDVKEEWKNRFIKFKSFLANKSISTIAGYCNMYLEQMNSPLKLSIDGYKILSNKKIREKLDFHFMRDGVTKEKLGKLSAGEYATIELAMVLTTLKLNNLTAPTGGLDFLAIDEVIINTLDASNLKTILSLLNSLGITILVVSHGDIKGHIDNPRIIRKKNGVSELV